MKLLIIGAGGREHALAWHCARSATVTQIFVAPGNPGTAAEPKTQNIPIAVTDIVALCDFASSEKIDLSIVGPEAPLVAGIVDAFAEHGLACFGPRQQAAQLEGSKSFAKAFMQRHGIPTAKYMVANSLNEAQSCLQNFSLPVVIKAAGLAAGKGVTVAQTHTEAQRALHEIFTEKRFGSDSASCCAIIEEFLCGEEASFIVLSDGKHILPLATSLDHKTRDSDNQGPNTGGMGAFSPLARIEDDLIRTHIMEQVITPAIRGLAEAGMPYCGFLYAGVMIDAENNLRVLEFNCRLGDPEAQVVLMRLKSDLATICLAACREELQQHTLHWDRRHALGVVLATAGYPDSPQTGTAITGLDRIGQNIKAFHAGTRFDKEGALVTAGGRVLCITTLADTLSLAHTQVHRAIDAIHFDGMFYRADIGKQ